MPASNPLFISPYIRSIREASPAVTYSNNDQVIKNLYVPPETLDIINTTIIYPSIKPIDARTKEMIPKDEDKTYTFVYEPYKLNENKAPQHQPHVFTVTCKEIWGYWDSVYFAGTVITTIGYGQIAPSTYSGRIFCMFYMVFGLTIFMVFAISLSKIIRTNLRKFRRKFFSQGDNSQVAYQITFFTGFIFLFVLLPALFFTHMEANWTFVESLGQVLV